MPTRYERLDTTPRTIRLAIRLECWCLHIELGVAAGSGNRQVRDNIFPDRRRRRHEPARMLHKRKRSAHRLLRRHYRFYRSSWNNMGSAHGEGADEGFGINKRCTTDERYRNIP